MSDHGSGPRALADSTIDITDMYVFPSPERPGALALVLNAFPFAGPNARFSDVVDYRLREPLLLELVSTTAYADGPITHTYAS